MSRAWLKSWKVRTVIAAYAVLLGLFAFLLPLYALFSVPSPYRPVVVAFLDETCGGKPANTEPRGAYENLAAPDSWRIAIYNGQCKHRLFFGLGGDDFHDAARVPEFTHRINAQNIEQASDFLSDLLARKPASVTQVEIAILDHGGPGAPRFARQTIPDSFYARLKETLPAQTTLRFYGCAVAQGTSGEAFMNRLAGVYGFKVIASKERVSWNILRWPGSSVLNVPTEDWVTVEPLKPHLSQR